MILQNRRSMVLDQRWGHRRLTGYPMERNAGRIEVLAGFEEPINCFADLERYRSRNTSRSTSSTEHRSDILHIRIKSVTLEVQSGTPRLH